MTGKNHSRPTLLAKEVEFVFREIFDAVPLPETVKRYIQFHDVYGPALFQKRQVNMSKLVNKQMDVEAVEFFLRRKFPGNTLTCKIWICSYLADAQEGGPSRANPPPNKSTFAYTLILGWFGLRSAAKWVKGNLLVYRHKLI